MEKILKIWEITRQHLNTPIRIKGIIEEKEPLYTTVKSVKYECRSCGNILTVPQIGSRVKEPQRCSCGARSRFRSIDSEFEDRFGLVIEDIDEDGVSHNIKALLNENFLDKCYKSILKIGNSVMLSGILNPLLMKDSTRIERVIDVKNIELVEESGITKNNDYDRLFSSISPKLFEELIAQLFRKKGYRAKTTPFVGDRGIDVLAEKNNENIAIQCKMNEKNSKVSNDVIQRAIGSALSPYKATKVMVITTSEDFTPNAYEQMKGSSIPCELWKRDRLIAEMKAHLDGTEEGWMLYNKQKEEEEKKEYNLSPATEEFKTHDKKDRIMHIIHDLESRGKKTIPVEDIFVKASEENISETQVQDILELLKKQGEVYEPKRGWISIL